jgi:oxygen-independent coproporphyrinogen-3 oxidase
LGNTITATLYLDGKTSTNTVEHFDNEKGLLKAVFLCFTKISNIEIEWGLLTGIRPARLFISLTNQFGRDFAVKTFREDYLVKESKIKLLEKTAKS